MTGAPPSLERRVDRNEVARWRSVDPKGALPSLGFVLLSLLMSARYLMSGVGYVLDDWFALANARFDGSWAAPGAGQWLARPVGGAVYAFVFGFLGGHPVAAFVLLASIGAANAVLFHRLARRFLPTTVAAAAVVSWVVFPNHTSMEVWLAAANISLAVLLTLAGLLVMLDGRRGPRTLACVLFVVAALSYQAVMPVIAVLTVVLPWIERGRPDFRLVATVGVSQILAGGWIVANWDADKGLQGVVDLTQIPAAHLGWGVVPAGPVGEIVLVLALLVLLIPIGRLIIRRDECGPVEWATLVGVGVIALGVLPFVRYFYAPLGAGDRFNVVSAFGGAILWAVIFETVRRFHRTIAIFGAVVVLGLALVARWDRAQLWADAAKDAVTIQHEVVRQIPEPGSVMIVIGPEPVQVDNVAAYLDPSNIDSALQLAFDDRTVSARVASGPEDFWRTPPGERVDVRPVVTMGSSCSTVLRWLGGCEGRIQP